jgi:hypothetical protein
MAECALNGDDVATVGYESRGVEMAKVVESELLETGCGT